MRRTRLRTLAAVAAVGSAAAIGVPLLAAGSATATPFSYQHLNAVQKRLLSGYASYELTAGAVGAPGNRPANYYPRGRGACGEFVRSNVKVNQNCLNLADPDLQGRAQAQNETSIAADPNNTKNLVASQNDYRRGDGNCYSAYSNDAGATWQDSTVPMSFTRGKAFGAARQYWEGGGDTSVAFDTKGNSYLSCQVFNRGNPTSSNPDLSSAFYVYRSTGNGGASWNFPGRPVAESPDVQGTGKAAFLDKQLMTVDNHTGSPFADRVYVTYTSFANDGTAYIYGTYSADYGQTFSAPVLISQDSPLCTNNFGIPTPSGACNENQFSQPFTSPDGTLYVAWANFNNPTSGGLKGDGGGAGSPGAPGDTSSGMPNPNPGDNKPPADNRNQMLLAASHDGGATFSAPVKAGDYFDLPDCATYQNGKDAGRACVPEKNSTANSFFRATNYPVGAVDPTNPSTVVVTYGSYINSTSNEKNGCVPTGFSTDTGINTYNGVKTVGACNNGIIVSTSTNGGQSFTGGTADPRTMPQATAGQNQATTDQFMQWASYTKRGTLAVSYYDRQYGDDEATGFSDVSVSGTADLVHYGVNRATSSSMPPPTQFSGTFLGDYSGLDAYEGQAHPYWSDTRSVDLFVCPGTATGPGNPPAVCTGSAPNAPQANDQDGFTNRVAVSTR